MTSRVSMFDHPFFLGFDQLEREFDRLKKTADGYPPYNVEQISDDGLRITLAVAGFTMRDLDVEVAHNHLTIRGKQQEDKERIYLHRGIATRQFQRSFMLADGIEVKNAFLDNGLLHIEMQRVVPETTTRKIAIAESGAGAAAQNGDVDIDRSAGAAQKRRKADAM
jgi:HSP20 family molecular chaperone IbpA